MLHKRYLWLLSYFSVIGQFIDVQIASLLPMWYCLHRALILMLIFILSTCTWPHSDKRINAFLILTLTNPLVCTQYQCVIRNTEKNKHCHKTETFKSREGNWYTIPLCVITEDMQGEICLPALFISTLISVKIKYKVRFQIRISAEGTFEAPALGL